MEPGSSGKLSFCSRSWTAFNLFPYIVRLCFTSFLNDPFKLQTAHFARCWEKRILSTSLALQWTTFFIKKSRKAKKNTLSKTNKALLKNKRTKNEISGLLAIPGHGLFCQSWDVTNLTFLLTMQPPDSCQAGKSQIDESTMSKRANERAFISKMKPEMLHVVKICFHTLSARRTYFATDFRKASYIVDWEFCENVVTPCTQHKPKRFLWRTRLVWQKKVKRTWDRNATDRVGFEEEKNILSKKSGLLANPSSVTWCVF